MTTSTKTSDEYRFICSFSLKIDYASLRALLSELSKYCESVTATHVKINSVIIPILIEQKGSLYSFHLAPGIFNSNIVQVLFKFMKRAKAYSYYVHDKTTRHVFYNNKKYNLVDIFKACHKKYSSHYDVEDSQDLDENNEHEMNFISIEMIQYLPHLVEPME